MSSEQEAVRDMALAQAQRHMRHVLTAAGKHPYGLAYAVGCLAEITGYLASAVGPRNAYEIVEAQAECLLTIAAEEALAKGSPR